MDGFYISRRKINTPDKIINTRGKSTGEAIDLPENI